MFSIERIKNNILHLLHLLFIPRRVLLYLQRGTYKFNNSCTLLYNIKYEREANLFSKNLFGEHCSIKNPFRVLFSKLYRLIILKKRNNCDGSMLVISTSGHEFKVIDVGHGKMITFYDNSQKLKRVVENRRYWQRYFNTIAFDADLEQSIISEKLVDKDVVNSEEVFKYVLDDYKNYFQKIDCIVPPNVALDELNNYCLRIGEEKDYNYLRSYFNSTEYRKCVVHGDVWSSNLIFNNNILYYTDFETVNDRIFYYDLFLFMVTEYLTMGNPTFIQDYSKGVYDSSFEKLFDLAGVSYYVKKRRIYLEAFFFQHYMEKWHGTDNEDNLELVEKTLKLFKQYDTIS